MRYLIFFIWLLAPVVLTASEMAHGVVFEDLNANGRRDRREKGIAAVGISNGRDVVLSRPDGRFSIPVKDGDVLFVIKPSDYAYPVDDKMLPQFFYIHKPNGSPRLKFPGSATTGPLPKSIDFGLLPAATADTFSIAVFADPQPYTEQQLGYYGLLMDSLAKKLSNESFGITLGDLTGDRPDFFEALNTHTAKAGIPWFHIIGNHDLNFDAQIQEHADETFELVYGPSTYAFNHGKVHFIALNNIIYPNKHTSSQYVGGLTEEQLMFIENDLKHVPTDRLVVLLMHIPLYNPDGFGISFLPEVRQKLFNLLKNHPHTFSMAGHMHLQRHDFFGSGDGWPHQKPHHHYTVGTFSGDWWSGSPDATGIPEATMYDGTPRGYNIITFAGNTYKWEYHATNQLFTGKMRIHHPKVYIRGKNNRADIYVNFFQGTPADSVFFSFDRQNWQQMRYTIEPDPFSYALIYPWDASEQLPSGSRPSQPLDCRHLWRARPVRLPQTGWHSIYVKAHHQGKIYEAQSRVRIENPE